jgi:ABC-type antimicrobial peptide transport system permease subunit
MGDDSVVNFDRVGPGYVEAIGARLVAGRDFTDRDDERAPRVALANTTMAARWFPHGDAVGHRLLAEGADYEIVGVVADTKDHQVRQSPEPRMYLPAYQSGPMPLQLNFELRAAGDPVQLVAAARRELVAVNGSMPVLNNDPLATLMRQSISQDLLVARVASVFGVLALGLAALGLYGVMTYTTLRRTSEFGVRMALGADSGQVRRMVLRESMTLVAGGMLVGVPLALATTRLLQSQLFGVEAVDPPSLAVALVVLVVSAAIAGYLPAARASRVGPIEALRAE